MAIQLPAWLDELPEPQRDNARRRFLLRLAALYSCPDGHLRELSVAVGLKPNTLATYLSAGQPITPEIAVKLEDTLGVKQFPRALFRPDIFNASES